MHTNVILTNKRRTHAQSKYTNTKLGLSASYAIPGQETEWAYSAPQDPHGGHQDAAGVLALPNPKLLRVFSVDSAFRTHKRKS